MVLEHDRPGTALLDRRRRRRGWGDLLVVDDRQAVLDHGQAGLLGDLVAVALRGVEGDVVGLPLERRLAGVDAGDDLLVDRAAVVVLEGQAVRVEDLELVDPLEVDAAVASALPLLVGQVGDVELDVELEVAEGVGRPDAPLGRPWRPRGRPATRPWRGCRRRPWSRRRASRRSGPWPLGRLEAERLVGRAWRRRRARGEPSSAQQREGQRRRATAGEARRAWQGSCGRVTGRGPGCGAGSGTRRGECNGPPARRGAGPRAGRRRSRAECPKTRVRAANSEISRDRDAPTPTGLAASRRAVTPLDTPSRPKSRKPRDFPGKPLRRRDEAGPGAPVAEALRATVGLEVEKSSGFRWPRSRKQPRNLVCFAKSSTSRAESISFN